MFSIIIPTSGTVSTIRATIESLCTVDIPDGEAEVVVVQNGPLNSTLGEWIGDFLKPDNGLDFSFHHDPIAGLLSGRHLGTHVAKGNILVFIDDDVSVSQGWLYAISNAFEDEETQLVGGRNLPRYEASSPDWLEQFWSVRENGDRWCAYLSLLDCGQTTKAIDPGLVWGLNFAIRKQTLKELRGFHPDGVPWDLRRFRGDGESAVSAQVMRKGLKSIYRPDAEVTHIIPASRLTIEYFEKRAYLQGISDSFTDLRKQYFKPEQTQERKRKRSVIRGVAGRIKRAITGRATVSIEKKRVNRAYREGFEYHQTEFQNDETLRRWVLKEDYWDYAYPKENGK